MTHTEQYLVDELFKEISKNGSMIESLMTICDSFYEKPVHNIQDMKQRNTKIKGDIFEYFCKLYLQTELLCDKKNKKYKHVWMLNEIPQEIREHLKLGKNDYGIDLVAVDNEDKYYAVQAKFRKKTSKKTCVTWKQLSTFYALCARTGPYEKYIVMTTADYVRRVGKSEKDITIGYNKLKNIPHFKWLEICNNTTISTPNTCSNSLTKEELRKKRLAYYTTIKDTTMH